MPMMIVDDEDFELEKNKTDEKKGGLRPSNEKGPITGAIIRKPFHGRNPGEPNVPSVIREVIADDENTNDSLAEKFGIHTNTVNAYKNGTTSSGYFSKKDDTLNQIANSRRARIGRKSSKALLRVLDHIDNDSFDEKLEACKATELSTVAANLSRVVEKITSQEQSVKQQNIIFYAPQPLKSDPFEVIDLGRKNAE